MTKINSELNTNLKELFPDSLVGAKLNSFFVKGNYIQNNIQCKGYFAQILVFCTLPSPQVCKSSVSLSSLTDYFSLLGREEGQAVGQGREVAQDYRSGQQGLTKN